MVPQFCFLAFVVFTAAAGMDLSDVCKQSGCGDYNALKENGTEGGLYFLNYVSCRKYVVRVSEDQKTITFDSMNGFPEKYTVQEDGCPVRTTAKEEDIEKEFFLTLPGVCDEVFLVLVCYDDGDVYPYLRSQGASTDCLKKAGKVLECKYSVPKGYIDPGFQDAVCSYP